MSAPGGIASLSGRIRSPLLLCRDQNGEETRRIVYIWRLGGTGPTAKGDIAFLSGCRIKPLILVRYQNGEETRRIDYMEARWYCLEG